MRLRAVFLTVYCVSLWIAVMGLLEYVFPGIAELLPGFVSNPSTMITADGFARAEQWTEIWSMGLVDGCRNGNDYEVCVVKLRGVVRDAKQ